MANTKKSAKQTATEKHLQDKMNSIGGIKTYDDNGNELVLKNGKWVKK